ncbi:MAG: prolyl oligopeptidase family serine peptidase [Acidimicrobiales bacterium]
MAKPGCTSTNPRPVLGLGRRQRRGRHQRAALRVHLDGVAAVGGRHTIDLDTGARTLLKQSEVLGGYDSDDYETWRSWATAGDGARIPISSFVGGGAVTAGRACVLYAVERRLRGVDGPMSSRSLGSTLLDRGFVFAIAHVRGGGEMGRRWYLGGKFEHKVLRSPTPWRAPNISLPRVHHAGPTGGARRLGRRGCSSAR